MNYKDKPLLRSTLAILLSIAIFAVIHKTVGLINKGSLVGGGLGFVFISAFYHFSIKKNSNVINILILLVILVGITLELLSDVGLFSMSADILAGMGSFFGAFLIFVGFATWFQILFKKDLFKSKT